jgi:uncharacterized membrane protein YkvA (DUF1232 family)
MNSTIQSIYNWYRETIRNPKYRWWLIIGSLIYLFSPIDISPDFLPVVGWIDDGIVLTLLVTEVSQMLAQKLKSRNDETTAAANNGGSPSSETVDVNAVSMK